MKTDRQPPANAKPVTKDQFFEVIGKLDVHPTPTGDYPYLSVWKTRDGLIAGYSKGSKDYANGCPKAYFLP